MKDHVQDLKATKSNLKMIYTLVSVNYNDGIKTMLKADKELAEKSSIFDPAWILEKVKIIVLGLDTKANKIVTIHSAMMSFMVMQQYDDETNEFNTL